MTKILLSAIRHKPFTVKTVSCVSMLMRLGFNWYQMNASMESSGISGWTSWLYWYYNNMWQMSLVSGWLPSKKAHTVSTIAAVDMKVVVGTWVHCVGSVWSVNGMCVCVHIYSTEQYFRPNFFSKFLFQFYPTFTLFTFKASCLKWLVCTSFVSFYHGKTCYHKYWFHNTMFDLCKVHYFLYQILMPLIISQFVGVEECFISKWIQFTVTYFYSNFCSSGLAAMSLNTVYMFILTSFFSVVHSTSSVPFTLVSF